jgi:hypothetical protein
MQKGINLSGSMLNAAMTFGIILSGITLSSAILSIVKQSCVAFV